MDEQIAEFSDKVWDYYHDHSRNLPWRHDPTPYQVFISEEAGMYELAA